MTPTASMNPYTHHRFPGEIIRHAIWGSFRINTERHYVWRAVDQDGHVLDMLVQSRRKKQAAKRAGWAPSNEESVTV